MVNLNIFVNCDPLFLDDMLILPGPWYKTDVFINVFLNGGIIRFNFIVIKLLHVQNNEYLMSQNAQNKTRKLLQDIHSLDKKETTMFLLTPPSNGIIRYSNEKKSFLSMMNSDEIYLTSSILCQFVWLKIL